MTTPSARPPLRFLLVVRIACEITGVGVYPSCASIMVVTPLAANTSSALANAGIDSAWESIPMNSGPVMLATLPVLADRLADGQDVRLIEGVVEGGAAMPRGAEGDALRWHRWIRPAGEIRRHQPRHIDQRGRRGRLAGQRTYLGSHLTLRQQLGLHLERAASP